MQILVNTDGNVDGRIELEEHVRSAIESRLARFSDDVTRMEVHLADESAGRSTGADQRCMLEARLARRSPVTVTAHGGTVDEALSGAIGKLITVLGRESDRQGHRKGGASIRTDSPPDETPPDDAANPDHAGTPDDAANPDHAGTPDDADTPDDSDTPGPDAAAEQDQ